MPPPASASVQLISCRATSCRAVSACRSARRPLTARVTQNVPWYGGSFAMQFNNNKQDSSSTFNTFNPTFTTGLTATYTAAAAARVPHRQHPAAAGQSPRSTAKSPKRTCAPRSRTTLANVRNAYWDLVFARSAVDVADERRGPGRQARRGQPRARRSRHAGAARHRAGRGRSGHPPADARRRPKRRSQTAELALKRFLVGGTDDPLWRQELRPVDLPSLEPAADRHRGCRAPRARAAHRSDQRPQESPELRHLAEVLPEQDASRRRPRRQLRRTGHRRHEHQRAGLRPARSPTPSPAATPTRLRLLSQPRLSELELPGQRHLQPLWQRRRSAVRARARAAQPVAGAAARARAAGRDRGHQRRASACRAT